MPRRRQRKQRRRPHYPKRRFKLTLRRIRRNPAPAHAHARPPALAVRYQRHFYHPRRYRQQRMLHMQYKRTPTHIRPIAISRRDSQILPQLRAANPRREQPVHIRD